MAEDILGIDIDKIRAVDCDAADILHSAVQVITLALERRQEMDLAGKQNETLYILAGESHDIPAHHIFNALVINGIANAGETLLVANETKHDFLLNEICDEYKDSYAKVKDNALGLGSLQLIFMANSKFHADASYTHEVLYKNLMKMLNKEIAFICNDAPVANNTSVENSIISDSLNDVTAYSKRSLYDKIINRDCEYRNRYMHNVVSKLSEEHSARIVYQRCGGHHVKGRGEIDSIAEGSLLSIFNQRSSNVLPLYLSKNLAHNNKEQGLDIRLPEKAAFYSPHTGQPFKFSLDAWARKPEITSRQDEVKYVDGLLDNMGLSQLKVKEP